MTDKEKTKAYDKAIERAKKLYGNGITEEIFPELKEDETERIKKDLIQWIDDFPDIIWRGHYKKDIIAWLEEQESYYTFEIKEGHWYKCVCDYMLNGSDLMFKNDNLYYCRSNWRLRGEIDERNVKDIGVNGYKSFFRPATNQEIKDWLEKQAPSQTNERAWLYLVSDVLTWKDGIGQYLDDPRVQELAKRLCSDYAQKLYNPSNSSNTGKNEQKSADKIEPRFKVGDWITIDKPCQIINIHDNGNYIVQYCDDEKTHELSKNFCESYFHFWTIQDVKDGDVLVNGSNIFIFHFINNRRLMGYCHVNMDDGNLYNDIGRNECFCTIDAPVTPATKEQRDALMKAMNDAEYEWDIEKKELKKKRKR